MTVLHDQWIIHQATIHDMINPFVSQKSKPGVLSYGVSSYGYDARLSTEFKVFTNIHTSHVDPKRFDKNTFVTKNGSHLLIPPNGFALGKTLEYFKIPREVLVLCVGKSTYARCGVIINVTPLEPEWEGYVTLEFSNTSPVPVKIYANEGICQFIFLKSEKVCENSYADLKGKYMFQNEITLPR
ncbi:MAG: deoxycytidine triphosphate deaminase [Candidatus Xenolissoclinum pacificiensis L6]|uniref:Deoxycytidine triphosphate deaminase n=1 Tax=Candidatus Xenolissoclinum pacificiensis L6 TaxID=1401685 RepID=W2V199_9RICK|nr:MAG: deoxycytidine triphosphate deaminase [Candidatus Xenolissoclinum pacificiensis L6]